MNASKSVNVSYHIVSDTSLIMSKIRVPTVSVVCPNHILAPSGHHGLRKVLEHHELREKHEGGFSVTSEDLKTVNLRSKEDLTLKTASPWA